MTIAAATAASAAVLVCLYIRTYRQEFLSRAAASGDTTRIRFLIALGADVNADQQTDVPIVEAAYNGQTKAISLLLKKGADPNRTEHVGVTPLIAAVSRGHADVVHLLIEWHADLNRYGDPGTALEVARQNGREDIVQMLRQAGTGNQLLL